MSTAKGRKTKGRKKNKIIYPAEERVKKVTSRLQHCSCDNCNPDGKKHDKSSKIKSHTSGLVPEEAIRDYLIYSQLIGEEEKNGKGPCEDRFCIRCLIARKQLKHARSKLKKLFADEDFLTGKTLEHQEGQLRLTSQLRVILENPSVSHYLGFDDQTGFLLWLFKAGMLTAYERLLKENIKRKASPVHDSFYTVPSYILPLYRWLVLPQHEKDRKPDVCDDLLSLLERVRDLEKPKQYAACLLKSGDLIPLCVRYLRSGRAMIDVVNAMVLIQKLTPLSDTACEQMIREGGLDILIELSLPGKFQKRVAKERDAGYQYYVNEIMWRQSDQVTEWRNDPDLVEEIEDYDEYLVYDDLMEQDSDVITCALQALTSIAERNAGNRSKVYEAPGCVSMVLRHHRHPLLVQDTDDDIGYDAANLLAVFLEDKALAEQLVTQKSLIGIMDRLVYGVLEGATLKHLTNLKLALSHSPKARTDVLGSRHMLVGLACYAHSRLVDIQATALEILIPLVEERPSVLHMLHSQGLVQEALLLPYKLSGEWEEPVPELMAALCKIAKRTLKAKWKAPIQGVCLGCDSEKGDIDITKIKNRGNECFKNGSYEEAIRNYTTALVLGRHDSDLCAILLSNRAECHLRKHRPLEVVRDTTLALAQGFNRVSIYVKTLFRRAKAFKTLNRPFEAFGDISACMWQEPYNHSFEELHDSILEEYKNLDGALYKIRTCNNCEVKSEGLRKCANCDVYYCSKTCQKDDWPFHKETCEPETGGETNATTNGEKSENADDE